MAQELGGPMPPENVALNPRPPPPSKEELQLKAEAKERGEKQLMQAVNVFADKADETRFGRALTLLEEARESFRFAGPSVERECVLLARHRSYHACA